MRLLAILLCLALTGCGIFRGAPTIKAGGTTVTGNKDAGSPATLNTATQRGSIRIPANSMIVRKEFADQPAVAATAHSAAKPAIPAYVETTVTPSEPTEWVETKESVSADTGTVDTSVSKHKIDVADRGKLLWVAIACGVAGLVLKSLMPAWPALSNGLLVASPLAFAAWKFAEVPAWIWAAVLIGVVLLALGYKRAEWDKNGDHIPDILQRKPPTT